MVDIADGTCSGDSAEHTTLGQETHVCFAEPLQHAASLAEEGGDEPEAGTSSTRALLCDVINQVALAFPELALKQTPPEKFISTMESTVVDSTVSAASKIELDQSLLHQKLDTFLPKVLQGALPWGRKTEHEYKNAELIPPFKDWPKQFKTGNSPYITDRRVLSPSWEKFPKSVQQRSLGPLILTESDVQLFEPLIRRTRSTMSFLDHTLSTLMANLDLPLATSELNTPESQKLKQLVTACSMALSSATRDLAVLDGNFVLKRRKLLLILALGRCRCFLNRKTLDRGLRLRHKNLNIPLHPRLLPLRGGINREIRGESLHLQPRVP
jgi:hypothetical protein